MSLKPLPACFIALLLVYSMLLHAAEGDGYYLAQHLTGDNGFPQNSIKSIAPDENGFIWLAMESALVRYDGRHLKVYNKDNINLRSSRFTYIFKDKKQPFLYAVTGLWQIVRIRKSQTISIDGADVPVADTLTLPGKSGRVSLWIATSYLGNTDNMGMEYKIEGTGSRADLWNPLVNDFISFNGPRSGTFVVTIRKQGGFGAGNYVYKQIFIVIPKAYWETWWFILLLIIGTSALVFILIKMRVHFLEQKNKELERVVSLRTKELRGAITQLEHTQQDLNKEVQFQRQLNASITHDIKTPIQYLTLSLKYLFIRKEREQAPDTSEIAEIFRASERISQFTNSLTGYVKVRLGIEAPVLTALHPIAEQKIGMFSVSAEKVRNTFINTIPENLQVATHPSLLDILLHNLIDNANKHTSKGTITISAVATEKEIILRVTDTGRGMPEEQVAALNHFFAQKADHPQNYPIGLGYLTIADILERLPGNIIIESEQGKGTTVMLTLPVTLQAIRHQA